MNQAAKRAQRNPHPKACKYVAGFTPFSARRRFPTARPARLPVWVLHLGLAFRCLGHVFDLVDSLDQHGNHKGDG